MLFYLALVWFGGAVATALATTASAAAGQPMGLRLGLFIIFAWPASLPWMLLHLLRQRRRPQQRRGICGKHWQDHHRWELERAICDECRGPR